MIVASEEAGLPKKRHMTALTDIDFLADLSCRRPRA